MNHGNKVNHLGRKKAHRSALLSNLASQLITHKRIVTTLAKAKALRTYVEPLITKTKKSEDKEEIMHQHRIVFSHLQDKAAVKELLGIRPGDNAEKAMIELVDFNEIYGKGVDKAAEPAKKTRRGRAPKKAAEVGTAAVAEAPVAEAPVDATETEEKAAE